MTRWGYPRVPALPDGVPAQYRSQIKAWTRAMRRRGVPATVEAIAYAGRIWHQPCSYCGGPSDCIDHILAVKRGGQTVPDNLASCCRSCNNRKGNRSIFVFCLELAAERQAQQRVTHRKVTFDLPAKRGRIGQYAERQEVA